MVIEEVTKTIHQGKIRNKLVEEGYYVSPLGLILENKGKDYFIGEIRSVHRMFHKKEIVIISNSGNVINGKYCPKVNMERLELFKTVREKRIPYRLYNWNN